MNLSSIVLAASALAATLPGSGLPGPSGEARIAVDRGDAYDVRALFDGTATEALQYRLEVVREGTAGRSSSTQGGAFETAAGRTDTLSTVRVSAAPGDTFRAHLVVTRDGVTVGEATVVEVVQ